MRTAFSSGGTRIPNALLHNGNMLLVMRRIPDSMALTQPLLFPVAAMFAAPRGRRR